MKFLKWLEKSKLGLLQSFLIITVVILFMNIFLQKEIIEENEIRINNLNNSNEQILLKNKEYKKEIYELRKDNEVLIDKLNSYENVIRQLQYEINELHKENNKLNEKLKKYEDLRKLDIVATHYTAFCNSGCIGTTATGYDVSDTIYYDEFRIIAVDPNVIPLYSIVHVKKEDGKSFLAIALDTGGAIKKNRIDILVNGKQNASDLGIQDAVVTIIREGKNGEWEL